ncbi:MAG TPA: putative transporter [Candidatus Cryptobacteroides intestinipullorum]|nr:putative transporter [Candidatus Cryptobacteroides intestinipullorum]
MHWLEELFTQPSTVQTLLVLSLISAAGLALGKIRIYGISLGITFVFFAGILAAHLGVTVNKDMLMFAQNTGLIIFIYSLGLQVGPGFFSSFKKGGIKLNMLGLATALAGFALTIATSLAWHRPITEMIGLFSGAATNTPMLGAAQQAALQIDPAASGTVTSMSLACAVGYPVGVIGMIFVIIVLRKMSSGKQMEQRMQAEPAKPVITEFQISNPAVFNKTIKEITSLTDTRFVISRVWRDGKVSIPASDTVIREHDHLLVISSGPDIEKIKALFGEKENKDWNKEGIDWNAIDSRLVSRRIFVTKQHINGVKLGSLRLRNLYGINITRVNRAGIDLLASPGLRLQIGDRLTIVGETAAVENVGKILGNEEKRLNEPNLIAMFIGLAIGVILGSIPWSVPGMSMPIKLGIAGGPIIVGILMGAFGPRFHLTTYTTQSANLMLREFGLVTYLAGLGLDAGEHFFETVFCMDGLIWIGLAFAMAVIPTLAVGIIAQKFLKTDYASNVGMLCGSMANPMALNYASTTVDNDEPAVSYATAYPLAMFARVIIAQLVILLLA